MSVDNKKDELHKYFRQKEKKNKRIDLLFGFIELAILGGAIALWPDNWQIAIVFPVWLISNVLIYGKGCEWMCIDEIDIPNSALGLRMMFKSWVILLPLLIVAVVLLLLKWWLVAIVYGFLALLLYAAMVDEFVF